MFDATDLVKAMQKTAVNAVESSKPANIVFGKVINDVPLQIKIDQKLILTSSQLVLSRNVTDYTLSVTVDWETESSLSNHSHDITSPDSTGTVEISHGHEITVPDYTDSADISHTHDIETKNGEKTDYVIKSANPSHKHKSGSFSIGDTSFSHDHTIGDFSIGDTNLEHTHKLDGTKTMTVHNALKVDEEVILMQMSGGQKYIVIDRIGKG